MELGRVGGRATHRLGRTAPGLGESQSPSISARRFRRALLLQLTHLGAGTSRRPYHGSRRTKSSRGGRSPGRPCWRSLSVGERLSARFRLGGRPVGRCVSGPSPSCAIVVIFSGALTCDPDHSRGQEGGGSTELFAAVSFGRSRSGAPLDRRLFSVEDANSPRALLGPRGAFTEPRRPSDALVVTRRHARPASVPTDALSASALTFARFRLAPECRDQIHLRAEGPCFALPVKVVRAKAREHLPSYREPASRNPQADHAPRFYVSASSRTGSPFLGSCPASAVLRASFRLAPCSSHHNLLRELRWTRRAMRPTNFCHPNDDTCTRTSCVPDSLRGFHRVDVPTESWASCDLIEGPSASRHSRTLRRIVARHALPFVAPRQHLPMSGACSESVGVFFPRRLLRPSL